MIIKAGLAEVAAFYHRYLEQIPEADVLTLLREQADKIRNLLFDLPPEKLDFAYAPGKWTVKELFGHMIDTERIMAYRALCIARGETQSLPGFDENTYVAQAHFKNRAIESLLQEYTLQRQSNLVLFESFDEQTLQTTGTANNNPATVRGIITVIAAHEFHHLQLLEERYLDS
jgi:uncharacterized damage-inducible protein DinB